MEESIDSDGEMAKLRDRLRTLRQSPLRRFFIAKCRNDRDLECPEDIGCLKKLGCARSLGWKPGEMPPGAIGGWKMTETYFDQHSREVSLVLSGNEPGSHWEHLERHSSYRVAGAVSIQSATPVPDGATLVLYQSDADGFYYGRPRPEFQSGRFLRLDTDTPHIEHFLSAVSVEADHQRQRWGDAHDRSKFGPNWYWLVGYLAGKALFHMIKGNKDKAKHHCVSAAAALMQWHSAIHLDETGDGSGDDADLKPTTRDVQLQWAVERWNSEVAHRPLSNAHRRSLDDTWRQVIRHFGGDPVELCGPAHDDLLSI